ncbi:hypothetical protein GCM10009584_19430 [Ornithinimicrobium humiphilum]
MVERARCGLGDATLLNRIERGVQLLAQVIVHGTQLQAERPGTVGGGGSGHLAAHPSEGRSGWAPLEPAPRAAPRGEKGPARLGWCA